MITGWETAAKSLVAVEESVERVVANLGGGAFEQAVNRQLAWHSLWPYHLDHLVTFVGSAYGPWRCDVAALRPVLAGVLPAPPSPPPARAETPAGHRLNRAQRRALRRRWR